MILSRDDSNAFADHIETRRRAYTRTVSVCLHVACQSFDVITRPVANSRKKNSFLLENLVHTAPRYDGCGTSTGCCPRDVVGCCLDRWRHLTIRWLWSKPRVKTDDEYKSHPSKKTIKWQLIFLIGKKLKKLRGKRYIIDEVLSFSATSVGPCTDYVAVGIGLLLSPCKTNGQACEQHQPL